MPSISAKQIDCLTETSEPTAEFRSSLESVKWRLCPKQGWCPVSAQAPGPEWVLSNNADPNSPETETWRDVGRTRKRLQRESRVRNSSWQPRILSTHQHLYTMLQRQLLLAKYLCAPLTSQPPFVLWGALWPLCHVSLQRQSMTSDVSPPLPVPFYTAGQFIFQETRPAWPERCRAWTGCKPRMVHQLWGWA